MDNTNIQKLEREFEAARLAWLPPGRDEDYNTFWALSPSVRIELWEAYKAAFNALEAAQRNLETASNPG